MLSRIQRPSLRHLFLEERRHALLVCVNKKNIPHCPRNERAESVSEQGGGVVQRATALHSLLIAVARHVKSHSHMADTHPQT